MAAPTCLIGGSTDVLPGDLTKITNVITKTNLQSKHIGITQRPKIYVNYDMACTYKATIYIQGYLKEDLDTLITNLSCTYPEQDYAPEFIQISKKKKKDPMASSVTLRGINTDRFHEEFVVNFSVVYLLENMGAVWMN